MQENKNNPQPKDDGDEPFAQFGFDQIPQRLKTQKVRDIFKSVSENYDIMNDLMSLGTHRLWKQWFVESLAITPNMTILDVAGGTGDITKEILNKYPAHDLKITVCDLTFQMMNVGRDKLIDQGHFRNINWVNCNAEVMPFADASIDLYIISFGFRNVSNRDACLQEARRILKPGGYFVCMEFSQIQNSFLSQVYDQYAFKFLPLLGDKIAKDKQAYDYLAKSIKTFPSQEDFKKLIEKNGFKDVNYTNYFNGLVSIHRAKF